MYRPHCVSAHARFASLQPDWGHHDGQTAWPHHLSATLKRWLSDKCLAQRHNKHTCRVALHTIPTLVSAEQKSCQYHFLKSYGMTRFGT